MNSSFFSWSYFRMRALSRKYSRQELSLTASHGFIGELPLFETLDESEISALASKAELRVYNRHTEIISEGLLFDRPFIVVRGRLSMSRVSPNGTELIFAYLKPRHIFDLVSGVKENHYTLRCENICTIIWLPLSNWKRLLEARPHLEAAGSRSAWELFKQAEETACTLAFYPVFTRIVQALVRLIDAYGVCNGTSIVLDITRQELASAAGTSLETAVRITKNMERDGLLSLEKRGHIQVVNHTKLLDLSNIHPAGCIAPSATQLESRIHLSH